MSAGILSSKFLDISSINHRFPEKIKGLGIPVTLLHNHSHAPKNSVLVYQKDFSISTYLSESEAKENFFPCSWFIENGNLISYEFCDQDLSYDISGI